MTKTREPSELAEAHALAADLTGDHARVAALLAVADARLTEARREPNDAALREAAMTAAGLRGALAEIEGEHARVAERIAALEAERDERERQAAHAAAVVAADAATEAAHTATDAYLDDVLGALARFRDAIAVTNAARAAAGRGPLHAAMLARQASDMSNRSLAHVLATLAAHEPARRNGTRLTARERRQDEADRRERGRLAQQASQLRYLRDQAQERAERFAVIGFTAPGAELQGWTFVLDRIAREHGADALDGLDLPPGYVVPTDPPGGIEHEQRS